VGIARALALKPDFIVCDEPIAALDVSIQAQVINLLADLQRQFGLTYLLIAHALGVVRHTCNRVAVMYLGKIVELASRADLYASPQHPYSQALLSAIPVPDPDANLRQRRLLPVGHLPNTATPAAGCASCARCPMATEICRTSEPELREISGGHIVSCHRV
jgi:oligopeptide transport system ATP-binding protein